MCGEDSGAILKCTKCKSAKYCSTKCQQAHWSSHEVLCNSISNLEKEQLKRCQEACDFSDSCLSSGQKKLLRLVGDKCQVVCDLSGNRCNALWDTGAQISLISR